MEALLTETSKQLLSASQRIDELQLRCAVLDEVHDELSGLTREERIKIMKILDRWSTRSRFVLTEEGLRERAVSSSKDVFKESPQALMSEEEFSRRAQGILNDINETLGATRTDAIVSTLESIAVESRKRPIGFSLLKGKNPDTYALIQALDMIRRK